jgi:5-hydroxyisourate hydrolase-like protein (transthyretin family)
VKFKDLEEIVRHKIIYNLMPFDVRMDFVKVTDDTVLVPVTLQIANKNITFAKEDEVQRGLVNIFGRVTTLTDRIAQTFEDTVQVDVPAELLPKTLENVSVYWKAMPLRPGRYKMDLVVKDVKGDRVGTWSRGFIVPEFSDDKLASSTLILADQMEKVPAKSVGAGNFVIGTTKVRPRVAPSDGKPAIFKQNQKVNLWMQVYNLGIDQKSKKPSATVEYALVNARDNKPVINTTETTEKMGNVGEQITLEKVIPPLPPGNYKLTIKVSDNISKQSISPTAEFAVE